MRHLWAPLSEGGPYSFPRGCTGCGLRVELRERPSRKARVPGQMVSVAVYVFPGGAETERLPDCDRKLLRHLTPTALPLAVKPTPAQELAELRLRFGQVQRNAEDLFARDTRVREILGAELSESTEDAATRVRAYSAGGTR